MKAIIAALLLLACARADDKVENEKPKKEKTAWFWNDSKNPEVVLGKWKKPPPGGTAEEKLPRDDGFEPTDYVVRMHDSEMQVTCWVLYGSSTAISCLPDQAIMGKVK